jgi:hypothetical protein
MPRENFHEKAVRYLGEARLQVRTIDAAEIRATCRGDSGEVYALGFRRGGWYCDCPARTRCAHLQSLMLVSLRPTGEAS